MTPVEAGIFGIGLLIILFLLKMPIAFAMAFVGMIGFGYVADWSSGFSMLGREIYASFSSYGLSAITLFVLMGSFAFAGGLGERLYRAAYGLVGDLRGGLSMATIVGCAGFAAICGSTSATAAMMGRIALPEMNKYGYKDTLSAGTVTSAGTLGILIPPSTVFIVYAYLTEQSVGRLFLAGIIPGIILAALFMLGVYLTVLANPGLAPPGERAPLKERIKAGLNAVEALIIFVVVIGGLFLGWISPVEAGGIGAILALIVGILRRQLTWRSFIDFSKEGLRTAAMILSLIAGAEVFGRFMAVSTIPFIIGDWVEGLPLSPEAIVAVIVAIFFIGGLFIDAMALITLVIPVIYPVVIGLDLNPIWFGVIVVLTANAGVITPPVGVNAYVVKGIAPEIPIGNIFKGTVPFLIAIVILIALIILFPQLALFLPEQAA